MIEKRGKKDLYFTNDHEWIDFQGSVAYVGVASLKLLGVKKIDHVIFSETEGFKKKGEVIATISHNDKQVQVTMPVDGKITETNLVLLTDQPDILLKDAENSNGWIALIIPSQPYERKNLQVPALYRMNNKSKYAKS